MGSKVRLSVLAAFIALVPLGASAQQMPVAPDGTSVNEPPAAAPNASVDACGNTPQTALGEGTTADTPRDQGLNPKDITGTRPVDLSKVSGMVVHAEGNLMLVQVNGAAAPGGTGVSTNTNAGRAMAVVRLPADCSQAPQEGSVVTVVGTPSTDGILDAELVQTAQ